MHMLISAPKKGRTAAYVNRLRLLNFDLKTLENLFGYYRGTENY